jgi:hypothetical protein
MAVRGFSVFAAQDAETSSPNGCGGFTRLLGWIKGWALRR